MVKGTKFFFERKEKRWLKRNSNIFMTWKDFSPSTYVSASQKKETNVLKYLMYLNKKRDARIKGRECFNKQSQQEYTEKSDTSFPTAYLAAIMRTYMIGAFKKRDVVTVDIPGASLQTNMSKEKKTHTSY